MWVSTRSPRADRALLVSLTGLALAAAPQTRADVTAAPPLPSSVRALAPGLEVRGGGMLTFFGIAVYDGWYWSAASDWPANGPYALDLVYHRDLDGARIAQRSVDEIARLGYGTPAQRAQWGASMARIFPDVGKGDRLTGVHTDTGAVRYFFNGTPIGTIDEPGFARAFFGIWLDPNSSRTDFRQKLLGQP